MTAFVPATAVRAIAMLEAAGVPDARRLLAEVRAMGVVSCICGALPRAQYAPSIERTPFSRAGRLASEDVGDLSDGGVG